MGLNVTQKIWWWGIFRTTQTIYAYMRVAKILLIESILSKWEEDIAGFDTMPHNE
mgnify:CR=1 FL=1